MCKELEDLSDVIEEYTFKRINFISNVFYCYDILEHPLKEFEFENYGGEINTFQKSIIDELFEGIWGTDFLTDGDSFMKNLFMSAKSTSTTFSDLGGILQVLQAYKKMK